MNARTYNIIVTLSLSQQVMNGPKESSELWSMGMIHPEFLMLKQKAVPSARTYLQANRVESITPDSSKIKYNLAFICSHFPAAFVACLWPTPLIIRLEYCASDRFYVPCYFKRTYPVKNGSIADNTTDIRHFGRRLAGTTTCM